MGRFLKKVPGRTFGSSPTVAKPKTHPLTGQEVLTEIRNFAKQNGKSPEVEEAITQQRLKGVIRSKKIAGKLLKDEKLLPLYWREAMAEKIARNNPPNLTSAGDAVELLDLKREGNDSHDNTFKRIRQALRRHWPSNLKVESHDNTLLETEESSNVKADSHDNTLLEAEEPSSVETESHDNNALNMFPLPPNRTKWKGLPDVRQNAAGNLPLPLSAAPFPPHEKENLDHEKENLKTDMQIARALLDMLEVKEARAKLNSFSSTEHDSNPIKSRLARKMKRDTLGPVKS